MGANAGFPFQQTENGIFKWKEKQKKCRKSKKKEDAFRLIFAEKKLKMTVQKRKEERKNEGWNMELKERIEQVRGELGRAIENKEKPEYLMALSVKLDKLIAAYLEIQDETARDAVQEGEKM